MQRHVIILLLVGGVRCELQPKSRATVLRGGGYSFLGGELEAGSELQQIDEVECDELGLHAEIGPEAAAEAEAVRKAASRFRQRAANAFQHHLSVVQEHYEYIAMLAARKGVRLWPGRALVASWLLRLRLTAFTSEVGESLRPLVQRSWVRLCYAVSWTYVLLDVLIRAADEMSLRGQTWRVVRTLLFFSVFHTLATMLLPAYLIHTAVHQTHQALHTQASRALQRHAMWAPTVVGLLLIPIMPLLDEPMEHALELAFGRLWPLPPLLANAASLTDYQAASLHEEEERARRAAESQACMPPPSWALTPHDEGGDAAAGAAHAPLVTHTGAEPTRSSRTLDDAPLDGSSPAAV